MDPAAYPWSDPLEFRRKLPLAVLGILCAVVTYLWVLSSGLFNLSPDLMPLEACAAVAGLLTILDLRLGLGLLVFSIGVSPEFELAGVNNIRMEDFLFPVILVSWFLRSSVRKTELVATELRTPLVLTILVTAVSSLYNSIYGYLNLLPFGFRLYKLVEYCLIFGITVNALHRKEDLRRFAYLMPAMGVLVGIYGLFQTFQTDRVTGPPGETANILGGYFAFHICLALGLVCFRVRNRLLLVVGIVLLLVPLVHTMARAAYLALLGGLFAMMLLRRSVAVMVLILLSVLGIIVSTDAAPRFLTILGAIGGDVPSSLQARLDGWEMFIGQTEDAPILGHGTGRISLGAFDNEFVRMMYQTGIPGVILLVWILKKILWTSRRMVRDAGDPVLRGYAYGFFGGCVAFIVHCMAATTLTAIRTAEIFFFGAGLLYAIAAHARAVHGGEALPEELPSLLHRDSWELDARPGR